MGEIIKRQYIAYFDLLGYKQFFQETPEKAQEYLNIIKDAIHKAKSSIERTCDVGSSGFDVNIDIKFKVFSDNIILSMEALNEEREITRAIPFLIAVASVQRGLVLQHKLLVRGGITIGDLYIDEDLVFGSGLIDAVELENVAEYPCIIVSDKLQKWLLDLSNPEMEKFAKIISIVNNKNKGVDLKEDNEYFYANGEVALKAIYHRKTIEELLIHFDKEKAFLNYLFDLSFSNLLGERFGEFAETEARKTPDKFKGIIETLDEIRRIIFAHKEMLIEKIEQNCNYNNIDKTNEKQINNKEKVIRKYIWLLRYHNSICERYKFSEGYVVHGINYDPNTLRTIIKVTK